MGSQYDLLANISEEGTATSATYKVHVRNRATDQWFQIQDLRVEEILPQMIFLSESYIQIWERKRWPANGKGNAQ
jgi:U4/U6.U5 tri-snRNP-associated protein 2